MWSWVRGCKESPLSLHLKLHQQLVCSNGGNVAFGSGEQSGVTAKQNPLSQI